MSCGSCHRRFAVPEPGVRVRESRDIAPEELLALLDACDAAPCARDPGRIELAIENSPYIAHARAGDALVAYLSAFSDSACAVFVAQFVVHPAWRRRGLGTHLLRKLEAQYPGVPVQVEADHTAQPFFEKLGYCTRPLLCVMTKPAMTANPVDAAGAMQ